MTCPTLGELRRDGWLLLHLCPADGVYRRLLLSDGDIVFGRWQMTHWHIRLEGRLPSGVFPTHFKHN
jgi:hypothetical protein